MSKKSIPYTPENEEAFFAQLERWNDEDEFNAYIGKCKELALYDTGAGSNPKKPIHIYTYIRKAGAGFTSAAGFLFFARVLSEKYQTGQGQDTSAI